VSVLSDIRFALRHCARHKATSAIIVAVLALGTGANTLIFSLFQAEFVRPAPAVPADPAHVRLWTQERATTTASPVPRRFTGLELDALTQRQEIFRAVAAWRADEVILTAGDSTGARAVSAQFVSPGFFSTLGVAPSVGRGLVSSRGGEEEMSAVLAHGVAEALFGSAAAAVGRWVEVNEVPVEVAGVAPPRFQGALKNGGAPALWLPMSARSALTGASFRWRTDEASLELAARLAPGVSRAQAAEIVRQVVVNHLPDSAARIGMTRTATVDALRAPPPGAAGREVRFAFALVFALGALILAIVCMNVSSLMVAAAVRRRHEIAARLSLGATRPRLIRQLVTESTILAVLGGAAGLVLAYWTLAWSTRTQFDGVDVMPDVGTFAFMLALAVVTGLLFGLSPALHATRGDVSDALRDSGGGATHRSRLQRGLVVAQIAASQPLLVLLGLMLSLIMTDYRPLAPAMSREVIAAEFHTLEQSPSPSTLGPRAVADLVERLAARPEVAAVVPAAAAFDIRGLFAIDRPSVTAGTDSGMTIVHLEGVAPGWFGVIDVPVLLGRDVAWADTTAEERPVVIGADLARALWGDGNPIGRRLSAPTLPGWGQDSVAYAVVGVYDASRRVPGMTWGGEQTTTNIPYRVYTAHGNRWDRARLLIRTRGPAVALLPALQRFVHAEAPTLPVRSMRTLAQLDEEGYLAALRLSALAGAGGLLALLLASLGLYGVIALAVRQRTREIGVRIAVGAPPMRVARLFLSDGLRSCLVAMAIGLPLSVAALRLAIATGGIVVPTATPYLIGGAISLALVGVTAIATWIPARRAALVDPTTALRTL
jgi:putative ABC transport system permease protein